MPGDLSDDGVPEILAGASSDAAAAIRVAQLLAVVVTPHRFRTRKQFWADCGLSIVLRSGPTGCAASTAAG